MTAEPAVPGSGLWPSAGFPIATDPGISPPAPAATTEAAPIFTLYGLIFLDPLPIAAYWIGFNLVQLAVGWYAFRLDRESPRPLWTVPLQQFVYRQLMYLVVIESVISALRGTRLRWQNIERTGDVEVAP